MRAYIMIEAMVGAGLMATVLVGLLGSVGDVRAESASTAREIVAYQLATECIEVARARGFGSGFNHGGELCRTDAQTHTVGGGRYTTRYFVTLGTENVFTSTPLALRFNNVRAVVSFPARGGTRQIAVETRIYER
jgi:hypothetical protein